MSYLLKRLAAEKRDRTEAAITRCTRCGAWRIQPTPCRTPFCQTPPAHCP